MTNSATRTRVIVLEPCVGMDRLHVWVSPLGRALLREGLD